MLTIDFLGPEISSAERLCLWHMLGPHEGCGRTARDTCGAERASLSGRHRPTLGNAFHALRNTNASLALACGVNMRVLQEQLGHRDVGVLLRRYAHLVPGAQREATGKIVAILERVVVEGHVGESGAKSGLLETDSEPRGQDANHPLVPRQRRESRQNKRKKPPRGGS